MNKSQHNIKDHKSTCLFFLRCHFWETKKPLWEHCPEAQTYHQNARKNADSFGTNFIWLEMEKRVFEKWKGFDIKMYQNSQKTVKTSELEDRYAVIFSLALWPEEPREIDFFKKSWFSQK